MEQYNPFSLEGNTILVTGASSGIGQAIAIACSKMGAKVVATGRNEDRLIATNSMLMGCENQIIKCDLTQKDDVQNLISQLPQLNGVVHCAGIGHRKPAKLIDDSDINQVFQVNFNSVVLLQSALLAAKKIAKESSIVFIASKAADFPSPGNAIYSASKGAIISYARCLALELAPRLIRVNCICPAMVWTDLIMQNEVTKEQLLEAEKQYPLKRYGTPDDIANLAIYLLSKASSWMTGNCVDITGGAKEL